MSLFSAQHLTKAYRGRRVVDDVGFSVEPAEIVGLLGPNGAGKTTVFKMSMGMVRPDGGAVELNGHVVTSLPMYRRARLGMGYLAQEPSVFRRLTVEQNLVAIAEIEDWLTVIAMGLLALITFANVLVRYFTDQSFAWTEEFSVFLMIVLSLVAGSAAVARNRQIRIEYFADSGSPARQRALARFGALMVFALFALMAVLSARVVYDHIRYEETTPGIGVPTWWYSVWLPVMSVAIAGRALGLFVRRGRRK